jgi:DNA repair protein RecN (Recombination protein N)
VPFCAGHHSLLSVSLPSVVSPAASMLCELRIANFAIIDQLQLAFAAGMNVLTGETGAGKSIVMRAIGLLCGDRGATDLIRTDADEAEIEGLFALEPPSRAVLDACGLPVADELVVRRIISRAGKGRVYVNGSLATAGVLGQLGGRLIHVYGQHEHALLLKPESHLELLDEFGQLAAERGQMAAAYAALRDAAQRLAALTASRDAGRQRLELLRFQVNELRQAQLTRGEEAQLQQERDVQRHAEKLTLICRQAEEALYSGDEAIAAGLGRMVHQLLEAGRIDPTFRGGAETLRQAATQVEEVALDLRRAAERIRHDPERLERLEERLAFLARLKRKYGAEADALVDRQTELEAELAALEGSTADAAGLEQEVGARATHAWEVARELSQARQATAPKLEKRMAEELRVLGMRGGVFRAVFTAAASEGPPAGRVDATTPGGSHLSTLGADSVEFYLSANTGEEPKPLARIASGGELSRLMLALKALTAAAGEVPTLIFDEVDAGIGGAVAEAVGKRLRALGRSRQILCITHLPQIAAQADHHFAVEKHVVKGRTTTTARALAADERITELTRMLGGAASTESQRYARRLMQGVEKAQQSR